jgi:hypothetical protein
MPDLESGQLRLAPVLDTSGHLERHRAGQVFEIGVDVAPLGREWHGKHMGLVEPVPFDVDATAVPRGVHLTCGCQYWPSQGSVANSPPAPTRRGQVTR